MNNTAVKKLKNARLWLIFVLCSLFVWVIAFYWIAQPSRSEKLEIWLGADFNLKSGLSAEIRGVSAEYGIKKCTIESYDPADSYYAQAFAMRANSVDLYILEKKTAEEIAETKIFAPAPDAADAEYLFIEGERLGIKFVGDYYIFVNTKSDKQPELLNSVIAVLLAGAEE